VLVDTPEEVVLALLLGGHPERGDDHAARIEEAHHVLDGAVLAGAVAALQHHQDAASLGAVQPVLQLEELLAQRGEALLGLGPRHALRRLGGDLVEANALALLVEHDAGHLCPLVVRSWWMSMLRTDSF